MITEYKNKMIRRISERALLFGIKHNPEFFNAKVGEVANQVAHKYIDNDLKKHGLLHCQFCNRRFPLKKIDGVYLCETHAKMLKGGK